MKYLRKDWWRYLRSIVAFFPLAIGGFLIMAFGLLSLGLLNIGDMVWDYNKWIDRIFKLED